MSHVTLHERATCKSPAGSCWTWRCAVEIEGSASEVEGLSARLKQQIRALEKEATGNAVSLQRFADRIRTSFGNR